MDNRIGKSLVSFTLHFLWSLFSEILLYPGDQCMHEREKDGVTKPNPTLLHQFLSTHVKDLDARTILSVLSSHDISASECAGYSAASGDLGAAVDAALSSEDSKVIFCPIYEHCSIH